MNVISKEEKIDEITKRIEDGICEFYKSDKYKNYLKVMSKFHKYSINNSILIFLQKPEATAVAGYRNWETNFKRNVKKGEKGIEIFIPYKGTHKVEKIKLDENKKEVLDANGKPVIEQTNKEYITFRVGHVFDVSQTEGEPLPRMAERLTGDVDGYNNLFDVIKTISPFEIVFEDIGSTNGKCKYIEEQIVINIGMSELQNLKTLVHELAHATLHSKDDLQDNKKTLETIEVEAESVAYTVCNYLGFDTDDYSFPYLASWSSNKELSELKQSLNTIREHSTKIISDIENVFHERELIEVYGKINTLKNVNQEKFNKVDLAIKNEGSKGYLLDMFKNHLDIRKMIYKLENEIKNQKSLDLVKEDIKSIEKKLNIGNEKDKQKVKGEER